MAKYLDEAGLETLIDQIKQNMSKMYEIKGSAIYADSLYLENNSAAPEINSTGVWQLISGTWTKVTEFKEGWVFNIYNEFTTDSNFVEGSGENVAAGTNIVVVKVDDNTYKFDALAVAEMNTSLTPMTPAEINALFD